MTKAEIARISQIAHQTGLTMSDAIEAMALMERALHSLKPALVALPPRQPESTPSVTTPVVERAIRIREDE